MFSPVCSYAICILFFSLFFSPLPACIENSFFFFMVFFFSFSVCFFSKNFNWRRIALQCCVRFRSVTWISCEDTYILFLSLHAHPLSTLSVITEHPAELPMLYSSSPLAILCFFFFKGWDSSNLFLHVNWERQGMEQDFRQECLSWSATVGL